MSFTAEQAREIVANAKAKGWARGPAVPMQIKRKYCRRAKGRKAAKLRELPASPNPLILRIQNRMAKHYGVALDVLLGRRRTPRLAWARGVAVYVAFQLTHFSNRELGDQFAREHTSISETLRRVREILQIEPKTKREVEKLIAELKKGTK